MARNLGLCVPTLDHCDWWFTHDLACAIGYHMGTFEDDLDLHSHQGAIIAESRNVLSKRAVEAGNDYIIFLDTDMRFPQDTFDRLMSHDLPVVAANCAKRRRPISATARKDNPDDPSALDPVWPDPEEKGVEKVAVVGAAVMCIKREVFFELQYPWFHTPWNEDDQRFVGEDLYFCGQLRRYGVPLYIDHGLSWDIGHIGSYTYGMKDVIGERKLAEEGYWDHLKPQKVVGAGAAD